MMLQRIAAVVTIVVVGGGLIAGFAAIGPPSQARAAALDGRRLTDLGIIADRLKDQGGTLPASLKHPAALPHDPVTGAPYTYVKESETRYRLCATFAAAGSDDGYSRRAHRAGAACFRYGLGGQAPIGDAFRPPSPGVR